MSVVELVVDVGKLRRALLQEKSQEKSLCQSPSLTSKTAAEKTISPQGPLSGRVGVFQSCHIILIIRWILLCLYSGTQLSKLSKWSVKKTKTKQGLFFYASKLPWQQRKLCCSWWSGNVIETSGANAKWTLFPEWENSIGSVKMPAFSCQRSKLGSSGNKL